MTTNIQRLWLFQKLFYIKSLFVSHWQFQLCGSVSVPFNSSWILQSYMKIQVRRTHNYSHLADLVSCLPAAAKKRSADSLAPYFHLLCGTYSVTVIYEVVYCCEYRHDFLDRSSKCFNYCHYGGNSCGELDNTYCCCSSITSTQHCYWQR